MPRSARKRAHAWCYSDALRASLNSTCFRQATEPAAPDSNQFMAVWGLTHASSARTFSRSARWQTGRTPILPGRCSRRWCVYAERQVGKGPRDAAKQKRARFGDTLSSPDSFYILSHSSRAQPSLCTTLTGGKAPRASPARCATCTLEARVVHPDRMMELFRQEGVRAPLGAGARGRAEQDVGHPLREPELLHVWRSLGGEKSSRLRRLCEHLMEFVLGRHNSKEFAGGQKKSGSKFRIDQYDF